MRYALNARPTASQGFAPAVPNPPIPLLLAVLEVVPFSAAPVGPFLLRLNRFPDTQQRPHIPLHAGWEALVTVSSVDGAPWPLSGCMKRLLSTFWRRLC